MAKDDKTLSRLLEGQQAILDELRDIRQKLEETSTGRNGGRGHFEWGGDVPFEYDGPVATYTSDKAGGFKLVVPTELLDEITAFSVYEKHFIVPVMSKNGDIRLTAVPFGWDTGQVVSPFDGQFGVNKGVELVFVDKYLNIRRDRPYSAPKAGGKAVRQPNSGTGTQR